MTKIRCDICNGNKKTLAIGMILKSCSKCKGTGEIEESELEDNKFQTEEIKIYQEGIQDSGINAEITINSPTKRISDGKKEKGDSAKDRGSS